MRLRGPLADFYPAAALLVVLALTPYLVLSTALTPLLQPISRDVGLSESGMKVAVGMSNAAYAFGTVGAVELTAHFPVRRLLVGFAALFVAGSALAAGASSPGVFVTGHVLQGLSTAAMLIAAAPALVIGWPARLLPVTAVIMNLGIFGAVALGPVVGGAAAGQDSWRVLLWLVAAAGAVAVAFALLTYREQPAQDPEAPVDAVALVLAAAGCAAAFLGVSLLTSHPMLSVPVLAPLIGGVSMIVALLWWEARAEDPLIPVRQLASAVPVAGITVAMATGAASVAIVQLTQTALKGAGVAPAHAGALFWPEVGGAAVAALLFGVLFRTRFTPLLALAGMALVVGGGTLLAAAGTGGDAVVLVGSGLVGVGIGGAVSPALFLTGFSLLNRQLPRVFALVELLRGVAAFLAGPMLLHLAESVSGGTRASTWVAAGIAAGGAVVAVAVYLGGGARPQTPRLQEWQAGEGPAIDSPPLRPERERVLR